ncbi:MAG: hypothetical protein MUC34_01205 [Anaerolineae bacterium]|nr:hypothetical protein [Anaerolineae bacterium]
MAPRELIPGAAPLSTIPGLEPAQAIALSSLWIDSAQALVGVYGTTERVRSALAAHLGIGRTALDPLINAAQRLIPLTRGAPSVLELDTLQTDYALGAVLEDSPEARRRASALPLYEPLAPRHSHLDSISLLDKLPPLRAQGRRGTCVAFAALAIRECLEIGAGAPPDLDLSEQYVYWWCKQRDGLSERSGTYLSIGMRALTETGAPLESIWPYRADPGGNEDQGPPPMSAAGGDPAFRTLETQEFNRSDIAGIKACLAEGRPIAFSLPVYDSWFKSSAMKRWGKITLPLPGEPVREGHALTIVGYQDDLAAPGGGYFLIRNSWQPWAWEGTWATGYGYIPYAYLQRYANAVFSARRLTGARVGLRMEDKPDAETAPWVRNSPDVWLRQSPDAGGTPQTPAFGRMNALYARVFNSGPACAYRVTVEIFRASGPDSDQAQPLGQLSVPMLWPGETVLGPLLWTPPQNGPFEFIARVSAAP